MLVIDADGKKLGVIPTHEALRLAEERGLNLVEVAPTVRPPVCRILDYGKYKYDQKQDQKRKRKHQVVIEVKEVKFRPKIEKHDFEFKLKHVQRFLAEGDKVKCTIMFRGRELAHTELGEVVLNRILAQLEGKIVVETPPRLEGRNMSMQIAAKPGAWPKPVKPKPEAQADKKQQGPDNGEPTAHDEEDLPPLPDEDEDEDDDIEDADEQDEGEGEGKVQPTASS